MFSATAGTASTPDKVILNLRMPQGSALSPLYDDEVSLGTDTSVILYK